MSSPVLKIPYNYEVCHIFGYGSLADGKIQEKLNDGWQPIGTVNNAANEVIMYFSKVKNPFKSEN